VRTKKLAGLGWAGLA